MKAVLKTSVPMPGYGSEYGIFAGNVDAYSDIQLLGGLHARDVEYVGTLSIAEDSPLKDRILSAIRKTAKEEIKRCLRAKEKNC